MISAQLSPVPRVHVQRGQTCKVYALSNAIEWLEKTYTGQEQPVVVRKEKNGAATSLRKKAKQVIQSKVGEVYGDKNFLALAGAAGFNNFKSVSIDSVSAFQSLITLAVDKNLMPIVMFGVNVRTGYPFLDNGNHEHAVIVTGYHERINSPTSSRGAARRSDVC